MKHERLFLSLIVVFTAVSALVASDSMVQGQQIPNELRPFIRRDGLNANADASSQRVSSDTPARSYGDDGHKRIAAYFVGTHHYNYVTDTFEKDDLYDFMWESYETVESLSRGSGMFDGWISMAGKRLTKENVIKTFALLKEKTEPGDEIFIYWNGHGGNWLPDDDGDESDGKDEFLVLYETGSWYEVDPYESYRNSALTDDDFGRLIDGLEGRRVFVLIEACFSGGLTTSQGTYSARRPDMKGLGETLSMSQIRNEFVECAPADARAARGDRNQHDYLLNSVPSRKVTPRANDGRTGARNDVASSDNGLTLLLRAAGNRGSSTASAITSHNVADLLDSHNAKDVSRNAKLCAIFSSAESEPSHAGTILEEDGEYTRYEINPVAFAYCLSLAIAMDENTQVSFKDFTELARLTVQSTVDALKDNLDEDVAQTPVTIDNLNDFILYNPPQR